MNAVVTLLCFDPYCRLAKSDFWGGICWLWARKGEPSGVFVHPFLTIGLRAKTSSSSWLWIRFSFSGASSGLTTAWASSGDYS